MKNFFRRLKNIWKLSDWDIGNEKNAPRSLKEKVVDKIRQRKQATIIDLTPPIDLDD